MINLCSYLVKPSPCGYCITFWAINVTENPRNIFSIFFVGHNMICCVHCCTDIFTESVIFTRWYVRNLFKLMRFWRNFEWFGLSLEEFLLVAMEYILSGKQLFVWYENFPFHPEFLQWCQCCLHDIDRTYLEQDLKEKDVLSCSANYKKISVASVVPRQCTWSQLMLHQHYLAAQA